MSIEVSANLNAAGLSQYAPLRTNRNDPQASVSPSSGSGQGDQPEVQGNTGLAQLQLVNEAGTRAASQTRSEYDRLGKIEALLGQSKEQAFRIIKMYPPYPPGDSARVKFLRSMNGLRKQIESLIIPPDNKWYGKAAEMQVPAVPAVQQKARLASIPELPDMADDAAVQAAVGGIDTAAAAVAAQRAALAQNTGTAVDAKVAELNRQTEGALVLTVPGENDAYQRSSEIKANLEQLPAVGLTGGMPLLQALG